MNQRQTHLKLPASLNKHRRRRNSKYERCKAALKEEMNMSTEASDLAMLATRQHKVWLLKPFSSNFSKDDYQSNLRLQTEQFDRFGGRHEDERRLKTEHSQYRSTKRRSSSPAKSKLQIQRGLSKIINPEEQQSQSRHYNSTHINKPYQQTIFDEHISQFCRAKEQQYALRRRISMKFVEKYPHRIKTEPDLMHEQLMARKSNGNINRGMITPRNIDSRNSNKRWTSFYSRSKKRCFMERYIPMQRVEDEQQVAPTVTFIDYLWDKNVRKSLSQQHLARSKQKILEIEKPGSKKQLRLRECLDKILMDSMLS